MHDLFLIEQAKQGDRGALEQLVKKYYQQIYKYIYFKVSHKETAQDLTQEVFLKLTKSIHRYVAAAKFSTFLYQIAHNVIVDFYRGEKAVQEKQVVLEDGAEVGRCDGKTSQVEAKVDLMTALSQLPEDYRECIILYYIGQLKHREIALIMDVPVSTVKTWIRRGLDQCKHILKSMDGFEV